LRVLAVSEKSEINSAVKPAVTNGFGNYDESLLQGLDYLLVELAKRDMTVVLYFNNFWQWSGGMTQYMAWIEGEPVQDPNVTNEWEAFMAKSASFYRSEKAQQEYRKTLEKIITRVNSINGKAYVDDATIMSWQLANEPRPGNSQTTAAEKQIYIDWVHAAAAYIKSLDAHHLVSSGMTCKYLLMRTPRRISITSPTTCGFATGAGLIKPNRQKPGHRRGKKHRTICVHTLMLPNN
jgi:mannan endo-1,4-beta-mannosidase